MFLKKINLTSFKNYKQLALNLDNEIILLIGKNGMGKTNLLDAIYYLSFTKSSSNASDLQNICHGERLFSIRGEIEKESKSHSLLCAYEVNNGKTFKVNDQIPEKLSDHIGEFPVVLFSPNDTDLVREFSDLRRKFFDGIISQIDRDYLQSLIRYNHFLKQRNSLLKSTTESKTIDQDLLDQYDDQLTGLGSQLHSRRKDFAKDFIPVLSDKYRSLSEIEQADIKYISDLNSGDARTLFSKNRKRDIIMQRTTAGIHRDDYEFLLGGRSLKKTGSQGQQKSFVISLRLAQFDIIRKIKGFDPIMLLDDIFDKLDDDRISRLINTIAAEDQIQIFITDARPERSLSLIRQLKRKVRIFEVTDGLVSPKKQ